MPEVSFNEIFPDWQLDLKKGSELAKANCCTAHLGLTQNFNLPVVLERLVLVAAGVDPAGQVPPVVLDDGLVDQPAGGHALVLFLRVELREISLHSAWIH